MVNPVERRVKSLSLRRADYRLSLFVQGFRLSHFHVSPRQHEEEKRFSAIHIPISPIISNIIFITLTTMAGSHRRLPPAVFRFN